MKKASLFLTVMLLAVCSVMGQYEETQNIDEAFDNLRMDGNIRLYLKQGAEAKVSLQTRNERKLEDYQITVENNTLYKGYVKNSVTAALENAILLLKSKCI